MKKSKDNKEIIKIVIVLTAIAVISGLLLGVFNKITYVDEEQLLLKEIKALYDADIERVDINDYQNPLDTQILSAFIADDKTYIIEAKSNKAYSSNGLKLIVVIKNGKVVKISGKGNSETPGLGTKALADSYLNQYVGLGYDYFETDEQTGEIEIQSGVKYDWGLVVEQESSEQAVISSSDNIVAISGATKSSDGVKYAVKAALAFYEYKEGSRYEQ